uniref:Uncharacterized protein n=1 Tax=Arundo donax TaxID=35708 RepID=A0A0A9B1X0_ARUDO
MLGSTPTEGPIFGMVMATRFPHGSVRSRQRRTCCCFPGQGTSRQRGTALSGSPRRRSIDHGRPQRKARMHGVRHWWSAAGAEAPGSSSGSPSSDPRRAAAGAR